jgi:hypothetical protein
MVVELKTIEEKMREIEGVLKLISESLPMKDEKVEIVFNELTGCSIDLYSYVQELDVIEIRENLYLLTLLIEALIECSNLKFRSTLRAVEINDKEKWKAMMVNIKLIDLRPSW